MLPQQAKILVVNGARMFAFTSLLVEQREMVSLESCRQVPKMPLEILVQMQKYFIPNGSQTG
jgi:hypothetical protein